MKLLGLMWSNLFRKPTRTVLTMLSVAIAFLLFMMLRTVAGAFETSGNLVGVDRLIASPKYSIIDSLPMSQKQQILSVDGVAAVTPKVWFGGVYQDPKNFFPKHPVEPREFFAMFNELQIDPAQLDVFAEKRTAAVAEQALADEYGWNIGDVIPIEADIWPKEGGDRTWEFELVGTYVSSEGRNPVLLFQYQYFTEAVEVYGKDQVGWWTVRLSDPARAEEIARGIDKLFENSQNPTRTATEDEFSRQFASQLGDIGFITTVIMAAVFFTIVLLTGNTMSQALRERIPELAVLKTLGFTDTSVSVLVLGESVLLCVVGALIGIGLSFGLIHVIAPALEGMLGNFEMSIDLAGYAVVLAVVIGLVIGGLPALSARRLTITDALRMC